MIDCSFCNDKISEANAIRIGEMNPICRECYCFLSLHFNGLEIISEEEEEEMKKCLFDENEVKEKRKKYIIN